MIFNVVMQLHLMWSQVFMLPIVEKKDGTKLKTLDSVKIALPICIFLGMKLLFMFVKLFNKPSSRSIFPRLKATSGTLKNTFS